MTPRKKKEARKKVMNPKIDKCNFMIKMRELTSWVPSGKDMDEFLASEPKARKPRQIKPLKKSKSDENKGPKASKPQKDPKSSDATINSPASPAAEGDTDSWDDLFKLLEEGLESAEKFNGSPLGSPDDEDKAAAAADPTFAPTAPVFAPPVPAYAPAEPAYYPTAPMYYPAAPTYPGNHPGAPGVPPSPIDAEMMDA